LTSEINNMAYKDEELLGAWVEQYYRELIKSSSLNGVSFSYYQSLRGYFKHSILLTDIKLHDFGLVDFKIWEWILTNIKSSRNPVESGGLYFRYSKVEHLCKERSYYNTKKLLLNLELLIETPFKDYYILNPKFIIKLYNPKVKKSEKEDE